MPNLLIYGTQFAIDGITYSKYGELCKTTKQLKLFKAISQTWLCLFLADKNGNSNQGSEPYTLQSSPKAIFMLYQSLVENNYIYYFFYETNQVPFKIYLPHILHVKVGYSTPAYKILQRISTC